MPLTARAGGIAVGVFCASLSVVDAYAQAGAEPVTFSLVGPTAFHVGDTFHAEVTYDVNQPAFPPGQTGTQVECCNSADTPCNFALYQNGQTLVLVTRGVLQDTSGNDIRGPDPYTFKSPPNPPTQYTLGFHYECVVAVYQQTQQGIQRSASSWASGNVTGWLLSVEP